MLVVGNLGPMRVHMYFAHVQSHHLELTLIFDRFGPARYAPRVGRKCFFFLCAGLLRSYPAQQVSLGVYHVEICSHARLYNSNPGGRYRRFFLHLARCRVYQVYHRVPLFLCRSVVSFNHRDLVGGQPWSKGRTVDDKQ